MTKSKSTKKALTGSIISLAVCVIMLIGTTFAWFTDTASTSVNKIQAGNLDVDIVSENGDTSIVGTGLKFKSADGVTEGEAIRWEPGCTYRTEGFKIKNAANLALKYKLTITGITGDAGLKDVITFSVVKQNENGEFVAVDLSNFEGKLASNDLSDVLYIQGHMDENAGNTYMEKELTGIGITVSAAQDTVETDSNNNQYDANATYAS